MKTSARDATIAWVITPHGFGHAARAAAIMNALRTRRPGVGLELFTTVPPWFFKESFPGNFGYHPVVPDLGLIQSTPMMADLEASARALAQKDPLAEGPVAKLASALEALRPSLVVCDIAPQGILAARRAGLPSILVENFTWDWIYGGYADLHPAFETLSRRFAVPFDQADYRIQTTPFGRAHPATTLVTGPVGRRARSHRGATRESLGLPEDETVVLVTFGGIPGDGRLLDKLPQLPHVTFLVPGSTGKAQNNAKVITLPPDSTYYHPDLVAAADAIVTKAGYSIVAEAYREGIPIGYFTRSRWRESPALEGFIKEYMEGVSLGSEDPVLGHWIDRLDELLARPRFTPTLPDGAEEAATFLETLLANPSSLERTGS